MKKLIALLLAIGMVVSLGACKAPGQTPEGTGASQNTETQGTAPSGTGNSSDPTGGTAEEPKPFAGKKLQIYGYSSSNYEDFENMGDGTYAWMVRAAVDEWAYLNDVEVEYVGGNDQMIIQTDIRKGGKPDLLLYCNQFPMPAIYDDMTRAFTQEEYDALAKICGNYYLDILKYKGESYGVQAPWADGMVLYYNKTQFEKYGVKSPADYFMEGNWNWDTYEQCITEITRDEDGDGINELYGSGTTMFLIPEFYVQQLNEDGTRSSLIRNSEAYQRYYEIYTKAINNKVHGKYATAYISTTPKPATSIGAGAWYNFQHMHQTTVNGDVIEVVPVPKYTNNSESFYQHIPIYSAILSSCDEPEATLSLLQYVLQAGMRYMSDFSVGLYKCDYPGIIGASEYSAGWKQRFDAIVAQRQAEFDALTDWDQVLYEKTVAYILGADVHYVEHIYPGQNVPVSPNPTPTIDEIATREEAIVKSFNELYVK